MCAQTLIWVVVRTIIFVVAYGFVWAILLVVGDLLNFWWCGKLGCSFFALIVCFYSAPLLLVAAIIAGWNISNHRIGVHTRLLIIFSVVVLTIVGITLVLGLDPFTLYIQLFGAACLLIIRVIVVRRMDRPYWFMK